MLSEQVILDLIERAANAMGTAYAPYSGFIVGAAVIDECDRYFEGANVENASYGLSICAERAAISRAVAAGARRLKCVVVVTHGEQPGTPCGACRQWMAEFGGDDMEIVCANTERRYQRYTLGALLPNPFRLSSQPNGMDLYTLNNT